MIELKKCFNFQLYKMLHSKKEFATNFILIAVVFIVIVATSVFVGDYTAAIKIGHNPYDENYYIWEVDYLEEYIKDNEACVETFEDKVELWSNKRKLSFYSMCIEFKKAYGDFYSLNVGIFDSVETEFESGLRLMIWQYFSNLIFLLGVVIFFTSIVVNEKQKKNILMSGVDIKAVEFSNFLIKLIGAFVIYIIISITGSFLSIGSENINVLQYNSGKALVVSILKFYLIKQLAIIPLILFVMSCTILLKKIFKKDWVPVVVFIGVIAIEYIIMVMKLEVTPMYASPDIYVRYFPILNVLCTDEIIGNNNIIYFDIVYLLLAVINFVCIFSNKMSKYFEKIKDKLYSKFNKELITD